MKFFDTKKAAVLCAAVIACASFAGCSGSDKTESSSEDSSKSGGDKKLELYIDDEGSPYFFDQEGNKMMLWASDYELSQQEDYDEAKDTSDYIYGSYDKNGISFTIPDGWLVDDSYGAPSVIKGTGPDDLDVDNSISLVPVQMMFGDDVDPNAEVNEKFIKKYYQGLVDSEFYTEYKILKTGEGKIGDKQAKIFDIRLSYDEYDEEGKPTKQTTRTIVYATTGDNVFTVVINCNDNDEEVKAIVAAYESFADTIKLPNADQVKEMVSAGQGEFDTVDEESDLFDDEDTQELEVEVPKG